MTTDKAIEVANKMQLSDNPLWVEVKRLFCDYEKRIAELERKLEQAEKDLSDYQFNYPTIKELQKENAELTCQMKRNTYCYSCTNATEKCYRKEIGCPCGNYKSYKDENSELKATVRNTKAVDESFALQYIRLTQAKKLLDDWITYKGGTKDFKSPLQEETERFLKEQEK